jgi:hypothetical protein
VKPLRQAAAQDIQRWRNLGTPAVDDDNDEEEEKVVAATALSPGHAADVSIVAQALSQYVDVIYTKRFHPSSRHLTPHHRAGTASNSPTPPLSDCTVGPVLTRAVAAHIVNTITSARHVVMRNDDRIRAAATNADSLGDSVRDQGYSRARVLVLVPFKCSAVRVVNAILDACPGAAGDISGYDRFLEEFDIVDEVHGTLSASSTIRLRFFVTG